MDIRLKAARAEDAPRILEMQKRAFTPLYRKYRDDDTSPAMESIDRVLSRITKPGSVCHIILFGEIPIGMLRVQDMGGGRYRISPVFVLPEYQGRGAAQAAFRSADEIYANARIWELATIAQEAGNRHLYEKLGYRLTGSEKKINDQMTIIGYERRIQD